MNKPKIFRALACALLATAFAAVGALATPVAAYANETVEVTDDLLSGGVYRLENNYVDYVVSGTLTNPMVITSNCTLTFNEGASLELNDASHDAIQVTSSGNVTIKNAHVVQSANMKALRIDNYSYATLEDCDFSAAGANCIDVESKSLTIKSGSYTKTGTSGAVVRCNSSVTIEGGTFTTSSGIKCIDMNAGTVAVSGGAFNAPGDVISYLADGKVFVKGDADDTWKVVDEGDAAEDLTYCVTYNDKVIGYFANEADANAFSGKVPDSSVAQLFTVAFDVDGGYSESGNTGAYASQRVVSGNTATAPTDPYKAGYMFSKWVNSETGAAFDFDAAISGDVNLKAVYDPTDQKPTITFNANGGAFSDGKATREVAFQYGAKTTELTEQPTKADINFDGWTLEDGTPFEFGKPVTEDVTLYANWSVHVAEIEGGKGYSTLQEAFANAKSGDTIRLLSNVTLTPGDDDCGIYCKGIDDLTFDLNGKTITYQDSEWGDPALVFDACSGLTVKNGTISTVDSDGVNLDECTGYNFTDLKVKVDGDYGIPVEAFDSTGEFHGGRYEGAEDDVALCLDGGSMDIYDGNFIAGAAGQRTYLRTAVAMDYDDAEDSPVLNVMGGNFVGCISGILDNRGLSITGGTFDNFWNAGNTADGYAMLMRSGSNDTYDVVRADEEGVPENAYWSATVAIGRKDSESSKDDRFLGTVYFENEDDATAFQQANDGVSPFGKKVEAFVYKVELKHLRYKVSFQSRNKIVSTRGVNIGSPVGELPAGEEVAGWTFSGWYDGDTKVDGTFVPTGDVTLVAHWIKNGSGEESDDPEDEGDDSGKGDEADKGGKSDKAMPQTGDTTNAVLPACIAIAGVLVCALGLLFKARKHK